MLTLDPDIINFVDSYYHHQSDDWRTLYILKAALALLNDGENWAQGTMHRPNMYGETEYCVLGALQHCSHSPREFMYAEKTFASATGLHSIAGWNDGVVKSWEEVELEFKKVIEYQEYKCERQNPRWDVLYAIS